MNVVALVGRLTDRPNLRYTANGKAVAGFTLAVDNPFKKNQAHFIGIVVWGKAAENSANYLVKGQKASVEGRLETRTYENKEGKTVFVTEVVANQVGFLEKPKGEGER